MSLLNTLNRMATDLSVAFKEKFYEKTEVDQMIENIEIDTSEFATKEDIEKIHNNKDVLDLLTTDGKDLFFNGKNVHKIELEYDKYGYSATILNVLANSEYNISITSGSSILGEQIVQVWGFEEGDTDITSIAKTFNNAEKNNFYYNSENIVFNDAECKIKDTFILENELNTDTGLYEIKLNKSEFIEIKKLKNGVSN